ncbi:arginine--tRNA ligase [bacterium]|nr:arginine--tRNA ligase [bacterium]
MSVIEKLVVERIEKEVIEAFSFCDLPLTTGEIDPSKEEKFGDYQCNLAMKLSKELKKAPREIALMAADALSKSELLEKVEVAGPGFLNLYLKKDVVEEWLVGAFESEDLLVPKVSPEKVIVEFSSPNIAKSMHVGHLRSTIIGDAIARLMEFLGYDVLRLNHVGDFGTQFGMLISYLKKYHPEALKDGNDCDLETLVGWYKAAKKKFDEDDEFKTISREEVVALQSGEEKSVEAWKALCSISRKGFHEIYDLLDVHIEERGESFYNPILQKVVDDFKEKGLSKEDGGAQCVFMEGFQNKDGDILPLIIQKSDGGFNYATTDLAAFHYRVEEDKAKRIVVVTDLGQKMHFSMVYAAAKLVGYMDDTKTRFDHVPFGLVLSPDGKKYKTRSGETEKLSDLLEEAVDRAKSLLDARGIEDNEDIAKVLGISAVKYADLSSNRIKDYTFSYDRMLRFEGNTAAFILYAFVRIQSIKRKAGVDLESVTENIILEHPSERALALHLMRFGEILHKMKEDLLPNHLTEYLYHLAEKFNLFFRDCPVIDSPNMHSRLKLADLAGRHLEKGLSILGIGTIDRM